MNEIKKYNKKEFNELLILFQKRLDSGEYTEKIPYEIWRKLMKMLGDIKVEYYSPFIKISVDVMSIDGSTVKEAVIFSTSIHDNGFGSFFYNHEIKERKEVTNKEAISAASACAAIDATKVSAFEAKADYMSAYDAAYNFDLTFTCDNKDYAYAETDGMSAAAKVDYYTDFSTTKYPNGIAADTATITAHAGSVYLEDTLSRLDRLEVELQKKADKKELEKGKEEETMKNFNFDFGSCAGNENIRMSMYGIAVKNNSGVWVSYNSQAQEIVDVDILNFEGSKYLYKMPVAIKDVAVGDVIVHNRVPMFVVGVSEDHKNLTVVDVRAGENKTIIPTTNMFGFNFCTKVVSLFNMGTPTADQPFGNMLPLLLISDRKGADIDPMMLMFMMNQGGVDMTSNPMMMYLMMKDSKDFDPMLMFMMMNQSQNHSCHCDKHHEKVESV